jgi:hypothetical protein
MHIQKLMIGYAGASVALPDVHGGSALAATVSLGVEDLVVVRPKVHAVAAPSVEVRARRDGAAAARRLANADVLHERLGARDRRLVDLLVLVDVVVRAVGLNRADEAEAGRRRRRVVLHDVVLDERVRRPAVDAERASATLVARVVLRIEVDGTVGKSVSEINANERGVGRHIPR